MRKRGYEKKRITKRVKGKGQEEKGKRIGMQQSVTNIFEYSNIRIYWSRIYIRTFVRINFSFTNIFGHSFVSNLFVRIYSDIRW